MIKCCSTGSLQQCGVSPMTDHLPECPVADGPCCPWMGECECQCMCDLLRVCSQRVHTSEAIKRVEAYERGFIEGIREGRLRSSKESRRSHKEAYAQGLNNGLNAAREAVAALDVPSNWVGSTRQGLNNALAAIDALRLNTADCLCPSPNPDCQHPPCPREGK